MNLLLLWLLWVTVSWISCWLIAVAFYDNIVCFNEPVHISEWLEIEKEHRFRNGGTGVLFKRNLHAAIIRGMVTMKKFDDITTQRL
ncbi:MAG: hypothetical protein PHY47_28065 [Lachnospiraceae bacterium]|nr:hypothetical protein [Lachnospiraceae bacterium]